MHCYPLVDESCCSAEEERDYKIDCFPELADLAWDQHQPWLKAGLPLTVLEEWDGEHPDDVGVGVFV